MLHVVLLLRMVCVCDGNGVFDRCWGGRENVALICRVWAQRTGTYLSSKDLTRISARNEAYRWKWQKFPKFGKILFVSKWGWNRQNRRKVSGALAGVWRALKIFPGQFHWPIYRTCQIKKRERSFGLEWNISAKSPEVGVLFRIFGTKFRSVDHDGKVLGTWKFAKKVHSQHTLIRQQPWHITRTRPGDIAVHPYLHKVICLRWPV